MRQSVVRFLVAVVGSVCWLIAPAASQTAEDWEACQSSKETETIIKGCTVLIEGGRREDGTPIPEEDKWGMHEVRAAAYAQKGDLDLALTDLNRAATIQPDEAEIYTLRGRVHRTKGDLDSAAADFDKAIELEPKNAFAYALRGDFSYNKGDYHRALADYERVIELEPDDEAYARRGNTYEKIGDLDRAIGDYTKVIGFNPKEPDGYLARGALYGKKRDHDSAIADYAKAIEVAPTNAVGYASRAESYASKGELQVALADYSKAAELDSYFKQTAEQLGKWLRYRKEIAEAGDYANWSRSPAEALTTTPTAAIELPTSPKAPPGRPAAQNSLADQIELTFWESVKDSNDRRMLEAYLDKFPEGIFSQLAKLNLDRLKRVEPIQRSPTTEALTPSPIPQVEPKAPGASAYLESAPNEEEALLVRRFDGAKIIIKGIFPAKGANPTFEIMTRFDIDEGRLIYHTARGETLTTTFGRTEKSNFSHKCDGADVGVRGTLELFAKSEDSVLEITHKRGGKHDGGPCRGLSSSFHEEFNIDLSRDCRFSYHNMNRNKARDGERTYERQITDQPCTVEMPNGQFVRGRATEN